MNLKKCKLIALLIVMVVSSLSVIGVSAVGEMTISVDTVTTTGGESIQVPIRLSDNIGICGAVISVQYNDNLTLTKVDNGDALSSLEMTKPGRLTENPIKLVWDGLEEDSTNGTIAVLTFVAPLIPGDYEISVLCEDGDIVNGNLNAISVKTEQGKITVEQESITTPEPTVDPTVEPTVEPTVNPTITPTANPTEKPSIVPKNNITVTIGEEELVLENDNTENIIIIAFYDSDNKLISLECHSAESSSIVVGDNKNAIYSKIMLWDSLKTMRPICEAKTMNLKH